MDIAPTYIIRNFKQALKSYQEGKLDLYINIIMYLAYFSFPEEILQDAMELFNLNISTDQPLSISFISKNMDKLNLNAIIRNPYVSEDTKTYIRMFI